ncbi:hypothetical protein Zmor_019788 [Zophobas morio]|uniref:Gustatory receptor n=1 Tax=Zophobas morio TaxID=2755281 RepID=A0AA38M9B7_9CUCU|nr:hypothetical protein Zmor_019788 [Zophobas morio]
MNFKVSVKDIRRLQTLIFYLNCVLVAPWYNFYKKTIAKPKVAKFYGLVLIVARITATVYIIRLQIFQKIFDSAELSYSFISVNIHFALLVLTLLTILKSSFLDTDKWKILMSNFHHFDKNLDTQGNREMQTFHFRFLLILNIVFVASIVYALTVWCSLLKITVLQSFILGSVIDIYYEFLVVILLNTLINNFGSRYRDLNTKLINSLQNYRLLGESIDLFNKMFAYQILLIILHCGLQAVGCLDVIYTLNLQFEGILIHNLSVLGLIIWCLAMIIIPIESSHQEIEKFLELSCEIQHQAEEDSKEWEISTILKDYAQNFKREFTADEFLKINKRLILSIIGSVTTYFIIAVQFNSVH